MAEKIEFDVLVNGQPAVDGLKKVKQAQDEVGANDKKVTNDMGSNWIATGVKIYAAVQALQGVYTATGKQIQAEQALKTALTNSQSVVDKSTSNWRDYASAIQAATLYGDEAIIPLIAMGAQMGMTDETIRATIEAATDLASATGMDLNQAFKNLGKTLTGQAEEEIVSMATGLKGLTKEELLAGEGIELVAKQYKGAAAEMAGTSFGKAQQEINALGDEVENLGVFLLELAKDSGAMWLFGKAVDTIALSIAGLSLLATTAKVKVKELFGEDVSKDLSIDAALVKFEATKNKLFGMNEEIAKELEGKKSTNKVSGLKGFTDAAGDDAAKKKVDEMKIKIRDLNSEISKVGKTDLQKAYLELDKIKQGWKDIVKDAQNAGAITQEQAWEMGESIDEAYSRMKSEKYEDIIVDPWISSVGTVEEKFNSLVSKYQSMGYSISEATKMASEDMKTDWTLMIEDMTNSATNFKSLTISAFGHMEDSIANMVKTGKFQFKDMANAILDDLLRMAIRMTITANIARSIGAATGWSMPMGMAQGGAFDSGGQTRNAQGNVFSSPTNFRFAGGSGLLGEKGSEAIMPLKRTTSGDLGVQVAGGSSAPTKVQIINESGNKMEVTSSSVSQDNDGYILNVVINGIATNKMGIRNLIGGK